MQGGKMHHVDFAEPKVAPAPAVEVMSSPSRSCRLRDLKILLQVTHNLMRIEADRQADCTELDDVHPAFAPLATRHEERGFTNAVRDLALVKASPDSGVAKELKQLVVFRSENRLCDGAHLPLWHGEDTYRFSIIQNG